VESFVETLSGLCREKGMGQHPLLRVTAELPVDMGVLYDFMSNLNVATSAYPGWLTALCPRVPDSKVRSIVFKLINDEYGNGQPDQIHVDLFDEMLAVLSPWRPRLDADVALAPGRQLRARAERIFEAPSPYEGLGVVVSGEISADQHIRWLGHQLSRQDFVQASRLSWYTVHSEVEPDHAMDSTRLCQLVAENGEQRQALWRGAEAAIAAQHEFLDALLLRHYPELAASALASRPVFDDAARLG
jgi:pyrroloquinoline quinone (PQQ) biosynthesis protein C